MKRCDRVLGVILCVLLFAGPLSRTSEADSDPTRAARSDKPRIVLFFLDNIGYGDLGCYGNRAVMTPNINRLAAEGVLCTDFYIGSPSCMPSRGALLTGRHPVRNGLNQQLIDDLKQVGLPRDEIILPRYLKAAGYVSGCFGKWNIGFLPGSRPTERGFEEYFGNASGNCDYDTHLYRGRNDLFRGTQPVTVKGYTTFLYADAACDFIRRNKERPFFCYVPFNAAHYPSPANKPPGHPAIWQAPDEYFHIYGDSPKTLDEPKRYRAVVSALDAGVGRVLRVLDELGLRDRTLVILLSDNGAFMMPGRGLECASNRPLKGGGVTLWEGGIRVPCLVRWPGRLPSGSICREPLWSMDFVPMILKAAGLPLPTDRVLDGRDPTAALAGQAASPHKALCWQWRASSAIRMGRYKLIRERESRDRNWQLFDLEADIGETCNLAAAEPERVE
ncbi:MAG TPA: hypothetical protein EYP14_08090 [Planctomycetaceae bacterium]|nr:hypothetical protein [Planctomycetaceae bacterium]